MRPAPNRATPPPGVDRSASGPAVVPGAIEMPREPDCGGGAGDRRIHRPPGDEVHDQVAFQADPVQVQAAWIDARQRLNGIDRRGVGSAKGQLRKLLFYPNIHGVPKWLTALPLSCRKQQGCIAQG